VCLVAGDLIRPFMLEAEGFPNGAHNGQIDSVSGVYQMLTQGRVVLVA
jgi:phage terminase large subunit-like protein